MSNPNPNPDPTATPNRTASRNPGRMSSRPVRRAGSSIGLVAALGLVAVGCGLDIDIDTDEGDVRIETTTFDGLDTTVIDVSTVNGRIDINVNDAGATSTPSEIRVRAEIEERSASGTASATEVDGRLELRGSCDDTGRCSVDYDITVPRDLDMVIRTTNGRVKIEDLTGDLTVSTANGRIDASGLASRSVTAEANNGRIDLAFDRAPDIVRAEAANGKIDITVPDDSTTYALDLASNNGSVDADVNADDASEHSIVAKTRNGAIDIRTGSD